MLFSEAIAGNSLNDVERDTLEARVKVSPDDQSARLRLVGYYAVHHGPARAQHRTFLGSM
jgi:hypothetical protein